jgi:hypothetical protein
MSEEPKTDDRPGEGWNSGVEHEIDETSRAVMVKNPPVGLQRKVHVEFNEERQEKFLIELARTGLKAHSANHAGVSYGAALELEKKDKVFARLVEEARQFYSDSLESEATRRAVDGWLEPVFSQKTGDQIGVVRKFSDRLLEVLLKAAKPEKFREVSQVDVNHRGGVLVVPASSLSEDEWEKQFGDKLPEPAPMKQIEET